MSNFYVYLQSNVKPGYEKKLVRNNIAQALKLSDAQANKLLDKEVILKKGVSHETAHQYVNRFAEFGAICRIEDKTAKDNPDIVDNHVTVDKSQSKLCKSCEKPIFAITERCQYCGFDQSQELEPESKPLPIMAIGICLGITLLAIALFITLS